jgi:hypothetical protein
MEFIGAFFWLLPFAAAIWALLILYRLASSLEDVTARLERIEKMVGRTRSESARSG